MSHLYRIALSRGRRLFIEAVALGLWLTGLAWLVWHYFFKTEGTFGLSENPLTHWWLAAHGYFAFVALFAFGLLWGVHIVPGWHGGRHRMSGGALVLILAILAASGYALYYPPTDDARAWIAFGHWLIGLTALIPFIWHRLAQRRRGHRSAAHGRLRGRAAPSSEADRRHSR